MKEIVEQYHHGVVKEMGTNIDNDGAWKGKEIAQQQAQYKTGH